MSVTSPCPIMEAAFGRLCGNHYGAWGGGRHSKHISKYVYNIYLVVYLAYFLIFSLVGPWSYLISEMRGPVHINTKNIYMLHNNHIIMHKHVQK